MSDALARERILLGVTGGIAAYKSPDVAAGLAARGAEVRVLLTATAAEFVGPGSFDAATRCLTGASGRPGECASWVAWARLIVVAPATADFIARLAAGRTNDALTEVCLASAAPLVMAPAMNPHMWSHEATRANVRRLSRRGVRWLGPVYGEMAERAVGIGRMMEPRDIVAALGDLD